jgi:hypothetical protein
MSAADVLASPDVQVRLAIRTPDAVDVALLPRDVPVVARAAREAAYEGFSSEHGADFYVWPVPRDVLADVLAAADIQVNGVTLAERIGGAVPEYVREHEARIGRLRPGGWRRFVQSLDDRRLETRARRWRESLIAHAASRFGAELRFRVPRDGAAPAAPEGTR